MVEANVCNIIRPVYLVALTNISVIVFKCYLWWLRGATWGGRLRIEVLHSELLLRRYLITHSYKILCELVVQAFRYNTYI